MIKKNETDEHVSAMLVQKHQLTKSEHKISELDAALEALQESQQSDIDALKASISDLDFLLEEQGVTSKDISEHDVDVDLELLVMELESEQSPKAPPSIALLDTIDFNQNTSWKSYQESINKYASSNGIDLTVDPYEALMTPQQRIEFEKKVKDEFTLKTANCDQYDYLIAGTCGLIGGLIDVFFVGLPGEGKLSNFADSTVDTAVENFAQVFGWPGAKEGKDPTKSAIGFLERKFKINYDQATTMGKNGTGGAVENLSAKNHHLKSLGHSPDVIGLFFSILNQFTNTSSFVSNGKIITIDTETFELKGTNFISKVFAGFVNWLGHLFSDMAGSSGAKGRGSGIPIPFYNLLLLLDVGEFGQHKQSFATIATKVFENGYDLRHGIAMAIPVLITELLTRLMWSAKQRFYHHEPWKNCIPKANNPELRRMLLIAHGSLCLIDAGDAAVRSGGDIIQFLLRTNIVGWTRFGTLALKEVNAWYNAGHIDAGAADEYIDAELRRLLK